MSDENEIVDMFKNQESQIDTMAQTKFYFYDILTTNKENQIFNWQEALDQIVKETTTKPPVYINYSGYTLSIHIIKKEDLVNEKLYLGYIVIAEDKSSYQKEKRGDFFELGFEEDESLLYTPKGKLYFLFWINNSGEILLNLEKQSFSINIKGFLNYFKTRYSTEIEEINSRMKLGKDLTTTIKSLRDNKIRIVRIYFKKYTPEDTIRKFGYVEEAIPSLLQKGIYADLYLHWDKQNSITIADFFKNFVKRTTFEEALDVDFGEFLKAFSFETDNSAVPSLNLLDKIICFTLPGDKSEYNNEQIFSAMRQYFIENKEKIV